MVVTIHLPNLTRFEQNVQFVTQAAPTL